MEFQTVYNVLLGIATAIIGFLGGLVIRSFQKSIEDVDTRTRHIEVMVAQDYLRGSDFKEFRGELLKAITEMRADIKADNLRLQNQIQAKADK